MTFREGEAPSELAPTMGDIRSHDREVGGPEPSRGPDRRAGADGCARPGVVGAGPRTPVPGDHRGGPRPMPPGLGTLDRGRSARAWLALNHVGWASPAGSEL